jgi:hypothetical protein
VKATTPAHLPLVGFPRCSPSPAPPSARTSA